MKPSSQSAPIVRSGAARERIGGQQVILPIGSSGRGAQHEPVAPTRTGASMRGQLTGYTVVPIGADTASELRQSTLVEDAVQQLGTAQPRFVTINFDDAGIDRFMLEDQHRVSVNLGNTVVLGSGANRHEWTAVGVGSAGRVQLARRDTTTGHLYRTSRRWSDVIAQSPEAVDGKEINWRNRRWRVRAVPVPDAVGDGTHVSLEPLSAHVRAPGQPVIPEGWPVVNWDDVVRESGLSRRRPIARPPADGYGAASLRILLGDTAVEFDSLPHGDPILVAAGNGSAGPEHSALMGRIGEMQEWFKRVGGVTAQAEEGVFALFHRDPEAIGNAGARLDEGVAAIRLGPDVLGVLSPAVRARVDPSVRIGSLANATRTIRRNLDAVVAHELGHIVTSREWGEVIYGAQTTPEAAHEMSVVAEAFSDLFGASFARTRDLGVRDIGRLRANYASLPVLRHAIVAGGGTVDTHLGTQLLTRPMLEVARVHGWDAVAEITGAATRDIGRQVVYESLAAIDIPRAATALRNAAAWRYGAESSLVAGMEQAWRHLRVLA